MAPEPGSASSESDNNPWTVGHHFYRGQIDVRSWTLLAPMLPNDDFSPVFGALADAIESLWHIFEYRYVASLQRVPSIRLDDIR